jgi:hypothetical protein
MELREALSQISRISEHIARSEKFVGYRSASTAFTGVVAILAAGVQWMCGIDSVEQYLELWIIAAVISLSVVAAEMVWRCRRSESVLQRETTIAAAEQFVPCLAAGLLVTIVIVQVSPNALWMLPGLWAVLFSMGIYSSRRMLPRGAGLVGGYYLLAGACCLRWCAGQVIPSGLAMAGTFGCGQFMAAGLLYWSAERKHG